MLSHRMISTLHPDPRTCNPGYPPMHMHTDIKHETRGVRAFVGSAFARLSLLCTNCMGDWEHILIGGVCAGVTRISAQRKFARWSRHRPNSWAETCNVPLLYHYYAQGVQLQRCADSVPNAPEERKHIKVKPLTVVQSSATIPPVSPELAFQHQ
jgi:hypothetical protein